MILFICTHNNETGSVNGSVADGVDAVVAYRRLVGVVREAIQIQVVGRQTVLRLAADTLLHHADL